jgi:toxin ParE1/3/4
MQVVWSELALRDLVALRAFIAMDRPPVADKQMTAVLRAVARLAAFPEAGRPGRRAGTRELVVVRTPYLVAYRIRDNRVEVLRVLHERQRWPDTV